jgi:hypothetical protein
MFNTLTKKNSKLKEGIQKGRKTSPTSVVNSLRRIISWIALTLSSPIATALWTPPDL